jgi:uncharacterized protein (TIGR00369 family)
MNVNDQVRASMREMAEKFRAAGVELALPPPSSDTLGTRYTAIDPGKMLEAEFAWNARFTNPLKIFQGGFLCAAFDEVFGPLTYMAAGKPALTIEMSTSFLRPFTEAVGTVRIRAEVVSQTKALLVLKAEARTPEGKLLATAGSHSMIPEPKPKP